MTYHRVVRWWPWAIFHRVEGKNTMIIFNKKVGLTIIEKQKFKDLVQDAIYSLCEVTHTMETIIVTCHFSDKQARTPNSKVANMGKFASKACHGKKIKDK